MFGKALPIGVAQQGRAVVDLPGQGTGIAEILCFGQEPEPHSEGLLVLRAQAEEVGSAVCVAVRLLQAGFEFRGGGPAVGRRDTDFDFGRQNSYPQEGRAGFPALDCSGPPFGIYRDPGVRRPEANHNRRVTICDRPCRRDLEGGGRGRPGAAAEQQGKRGEPAVC